MVSRHVAALEQQLGWRLFERTGRGVVMTAAASQLAPQLRAAIDDMRRATQQAGEQGDPLAGVVRAERGAPGAC